MLTVEHATDAPPTIDPLPSAWRALLSRTPTDSALTLRRQLELPTDRPVIAGGHQAQVWHAGILAKHLAISGGAEALDAATVWLVVDTDTTDPSLVRYPARDDDGQLVDARLDADPPMREGVPPAFLAATLLSEPGLAPASESVAQGLERIRGAYAAHADAPSAAVQHTRVIDQLIEPIGPLIPHVLETALSGTDLFGELLDRMADDPARCVGAYNEAARLHPDVRIRELEVTDERTELPLWAIEPGQARRPLFADELKTIDRAHVAPRALMLSAIIRSGLCDLYVQGTGGVAYDRVTGAWMERWLGRTLGPAVVVTATRTLSLHDLDLPTDEVVAQARDRAHKAKHDPALVGDEQAADDKRRILEDVERAKASGENPAPLFKRMQEILAEHRERNSEKLAELEREAERLSEQAQHRELADDRTWPFPLLSAGALASLNDQCRSAFGL